MPVTKKEKDPGKAILELVDKMHEEKKIPREVIFHGIEAAIQLAAERHFQVEEGVLVKIDQATGHILARHGELELDPETLGRIAAQSAKQVMIQKISEAGYRSKVAVTSIDLKVDAVGACVGVRGSRIKNVIEELNGERIDIVRWNDALQVLIPNALQPAQISEVFTYARLGRAIVLVTDDQLSLAIGRRGQNVRLASKLVGWDIEIMTHDELGEALERAERWFGQLPHASAELTGALIEEGFLSYNDITCTDAAGLSEFAGLNEEQSDEVVMYAVEYSDVMDQSVEEERRQAEEEASRLAEEQAAAEAEAAAAAEAEAAANPAPEAEAAANPAPEAATEEVPPTETSTEEANAATAEVSGESPAEAAAE
jgi:N utilization substance protein A